MINLFSFLSHAIEGAPIVAIAASFVWGVFSIILSPCHLTSIPLVIGILSRQKKLSIKNALFLSTLFSVGILISIAVIGGITAAAGRILGDIGKTGNYAVALVFLIFGLNLLGILPISWPSLSSLNSRREGYLSVLSLGLVFGLALGPCTFAFMAPMLGVVFNMTAKDLLYGLSLLAAFAIGHCTVIIAAGTSVRLVQNITSWDDKSKGITIIRKICGLLVLLGGIYLIYSTF